MKLFLLKQMRIFMNILSLKYRGGVLNVYTEYNIRDAERKRVYVTMKEINSVRTTSAGDVFGETPVKSDRLELSASSAGDIKLEVMQKISILISAVQVI